MVFSQTMPANLIPFLSNASSPTSIPTDLTKFPGMDTILLLAYFFVPGFISMKFYDVLQSREQPRDFSDVYEAFGYSFINFVFMYPFITNEWVDSLLKGNIIIDFIFFVLYLIIMPIIWPFLYSFIITDRLIKKRQSKIHLPVWDQKFSENKERWIIVHLKDGRSVGGWYGTNSRSSAFPAKEQIFLEEVYSVNENGGFGEIVERTDGMLILGDDISSIEFFKLEDDIR
jgi:hypothetical protein